MNDSYMEYMVRKERSPLHALAGYMCLFLAIVSLLLGIIQPIALLFFAVFAVGFYFINSRKVIEYEYLYLDKEITIDKIIGMRKRKRVENIKMNSIEIFAPVTSYQAKDAVKRARGSEYDYSSGRKETAEDCYVIVNGVGNQIIIEPSVKFVKTTQMAAPRKVIIQ